MEMQRFYETLYITRPDISDEDISKVQNTLNDIITNNKGEVLKSEKWAERELSYAIENYTKGIYYLMVYKSPPKVVTELEKSAGSSADTRALAAGSVPLGRGDQTGSRR